MRQLETILIAAPAGSVSGGPELLHQLCYHLNCLGLDSYLYYYEETGKLVDMEAPKPYEKYKTRHVKDASLLKKEATALIIPEIAVPLLRLFGCHQRYIWWLSVDNYKDAYQDILKTMPNGKSDIFRLSGQENILHLVQSEYAGHFVHTDIGVPKNQIFYLSDYLNSEFYSIQIAPRFKQNFIAYNPKKGYDVLKPIMDASPQFTWMPIIHMSAKDVGNLLRLSKIYIDFGNHPGKDRIPREAAISGCCVITNKKGSAGFYGDLPIPETYKFADANASSPEIIALIQDIFEHYEEHRRNFESYCDIIRSEEKRFVEDIQKIFIPRGNTV